MVKPVDYNSLVYELAAEHGRDFLLERVSQVTTNNANSNPSLAVAMAEDEFW